MNKKVMMDDRASIYLIMPIFIALLAPGCPKRYLIRPEISMESDASAGM